MWHPASPQAVGLQSDRWHQTLRLLRGWCDSRKIPSAGLLFARHGRTTGVQMLGHQTLAADSPPLRDDAIFLVASLTKPVVAMSLVMLAERGLITLDDRVENYIPDFGKNGKVTTTIRHLLTHTSGLPDMLPNNRELREANAPLSEFVKGTCAVRPDFTPGFGVQYQSAGLLMAAEIVHQVTGKTCAQFLHDEIFTPLGMKDTALGAPHSWFEGPDPKVSRIAEVRVPEDQLTATTWNWNSAYWRKLGAPWGGLLTTPSDLGRFLQMMLNLGRVGDQQLLSPRAIQAATRNQLADMKDVPADERRCRPWGLAWRLNWPAHSANFGDFLGPRCYGHWGATGTLMWVDPDLQAFLILLTTQPQEPHGNYLARLSNTITAAIV